MPSSVIRHFSYDERARRLRVTFVSGDVYDYLDVPPDLPVEWRAAFSKGVFFAERVRDRFDYRLVEKAWR
jgi:hypothetical protein